jgi:hypothetical protein
VRFGLLGGVVSRITFCCEYILLYQNGSSNSIYKTFNHSHGVRVIGVDLLQAGICSLIIARPFGQTMLHVIVAFVMLFIFVSRVMFCDFV